MADKRAADIREIFNDPATVAQQPFVCKFCGEWRSEHAEIVAGHEDRAHSDERIAELRAEIERLRTLLDQS